ncbi:proline dehydrogenase [Natronococcus pandeyae]|uniref:Proline dehydrogenase n=1 Tax=Natronococcus pandeyae TaxID=2055836 RepID=A0A8J8TQX1_9EURY|nr:proline dehydrogenase family protein [Natronococcus pandeyae]TYL38948.1 proline dehydrogenase [Natronococcus pandeyae]
MIPPVASRFVAGETEAEALEHVRRLNERGICGMVNRLGTHHDDHQQVHADTRAYRELVADIGDTGLDGEVSVKPSQLGLDLGEDVFRDSLGEVLETARERDVFVWLDMEEHTTTDATLDAFEAFALEEGGGSSGTRSSSGRRSDGGIGVCLQANLKRTPEDAERLAELPGKVRFVRGGAYDEPRAVAYRDPERMDRAYRDVLEYAFESYDDGIAVATHDPEILEHARSLHERYDTPFEIQMLMGVRPEAQVELAAEYDVRQYVPYGTRWKRYFLNRITETEHTLRFVLRALLDGARTDGLSRVSPEEQVQHDAE